MAIILNRISLLILISVGLLLTGCATTMSRVPSNSPSMLEVYHAAMQESDGHSLNRIRKRVQRTSIHRTTTAVQKAESAYSNSRRKQSPGVTSTRTHLTALNQQFPMLPNPEIALYVYPHLAGNNQLPVLGYASAFTLYQKNYFALPGEIATQGIG